MFRNFRKLFEKWFGAYDYFHITYIIYCVGGVWTIQRKYIKGSQRRILFDTTRAVVLALFIWVLIGLPYDAYLSRHNLQKFTYSLSYAVFFVCLSFRTIILIPRKEQLDDCVKLLDRNFNLDNVGKSYSDINILNNGKRKMEKLTKILYILVVLSVVSRAICQLLPPKSTMIPYPFQYPIESPFFEILFVSQTIGVFHFVIVEVAYELVICGFLIRLSNHFEIITKNTQEMYSIYKKEDVYTDWSDESCVRNRSDFIRLQLMEWGKKTSNFSKWQDERTGMLLKQTIIHHQHILAMMKQMNEINGSPSLLQLLGIVLLMGILCTDVIWQSKELSPKLIAQSFYAVSTLLDLSVLCYFGTTLETKSQEAANALYDTPWFQMSISNRKTVKLFLMALWKQPSLRAGNVLPLNFRTFLKLIDHIYSGIAFMQNTASKREE